MQVLSDVKKGMALLRWELYFTHRLLGIRMHTKGAKWWFICISNIKKELNDSREEKVSKNCTLYFLDDM